MAEQGHAPIPGWPGYFAARDGRVFSATGWRGAAYRELIADLNADGYPSVRLTVPIKKRSRMAVHRLMALTFLPTRPSPDHEVRHLDGDRMNRAADNLAWGTRAENAADRERHGRTSRGETHSRSIREAFEKLPPRVHRSGYRLNLTPEQRKARADRTRAQRAAAKAEGGAS